MWLRRFASQIFQNPAESRPAITPPQHQMERNREANFQDEMAMFDFEDLQNSASLHEMLGIDRGTPFSQVECVISLTMDELLALKAHVNLKSDNQLMTVSLNVVLKEDNYWIVVDSNPFGYYDDLERMKIQAITNASILKFFHNKGTHDTSSTYLFGNTCCDSLSQAVQLMFDFFDQFKFIILQLDIPEDSSPDLIISLSSRLRKSTATLIKLKITALFHPSHAKLIDVAYDLGCDFFKIRHVRRIDGDVRTELSFESILRSVLFKVMFGEGKDAHLRFAREVEAILDGRTLCNAVFYSGGNWSDFKNIDPFVFLKLEEEDYLNFDRRHGEYLLVPYCEKRIVRLASV